jgi:hypothetical protein
MYVIVKFTVSRTLVKSVVDLNERFGGEIILCHCLVVWSVIE